MGDRDELVIREQLSVLLSLSWWEDVGSTLSHLFVDYPLFFYVNILLIYAQIEREYKLIYRDSINLFFLISNFPA